MFNGMPEAGSDITNLGTCYELEVRPSVPERIARLEELANDLYYTWSIEVRRMFHYMDRDLWLSTGHSPKLFLRRVSQRKLDEAAKDRVFLENYNRILSAYDTYLQEKGSKEFEGWLDPHKDLVAYFCAEFGFHESVPIYSGGLGILAADHCKAASDLGLPFVAVGLLYRQGYFNQTIDGYGNQVATYTPSNFDHLPIAPAFDPSGNEIRVALALGERQVISKVWQARVGHIQLYLLDTDIPENAPEDRRITFQLYVGDIATRLQQEIVLGVGGVRALRALGLAPTVWHVNEGHPAFQILERCRELVGGGLDCDAALEQVAANTVFTTHTPVPAGHDIFDHGLIQRYLSGFAGELGIPLDQMLAMGASPGNDGGFNMTALALRGSRYHNGVSRIHRQVTAEMVRYIWPQVPQSESPVGHVTNGVHLPTFLANDWQNLFDLEFGSEWRRELLNPGYWQHRIDQLADHQFWSTRQSLKSFMLRNVRDRAIWQHRRNGYSEVEIERITRHLHPLNNDVLIIGFARRFATYKRATLLLSDARRLVRLLNDSARPMLVIFAGKAHPSDIPGQEFIRTIHQMSRQREFEGKLLLLEGYDMALARRLVAGVDIWLNTPEFPLEASGTSGQKAGMNGVVNLSVLDGWWGEGFNGENGWAIPSHHNRETDPATRDEIEGQVLLDILEHQIIPLYYERNGRGYPERWVKMSKASMKSVIPHFNASRMLRDYVRDYYGPASKVGRTLSEGNGAAASELANWKRKVANKWPNVKARRVDTPQPAIQADTTISLRVAVTLDGLNTEDVNVECLLGARNPSGHLTMHSRYRLQPQQQGSGDETIYALDLKPPLSGLQCYKLRVYPYHERLSHPHETGLMIWV